MGLTTAAADRRNPPALASALASQRDVGGQEGHRHRVSWTKEIEAKYNAEKEKDAVVEELGKELRATLELKTPPATPSRSQMAKNCLTTISKALERRQVRHQRSGSPRLAVSNDHSLRRVKTRQSARLHYLASTILIF